MNFRQSSERKTFLGFTIGDITNILIVLGAVLMFVLNYNSRLVVVETNQTSNTKNIEILTDNVNDLYVLMINSPGQKETRKKHNKRKAPGE